jgi:hypothetical protein
MIDPFVIFVCVEGFAIVMLIVIWVGIDFHHVVPHGHLVPEWIALIYPPANRGGNSPGEVADTSRTFPNQKTIEEWHGAPVSVEE